MENGGIVFAIYAAVISLVQGIVDVWMIDSFVKCRSGKKFANIILLTLIVLHDLFSSVYGGEDKYILLGVEMLVFYPTILLLFYRCYKGYAHWNLIYLLSFEWCFLLIGTVVTMPVLAIICNFDLSKIEGYMDEPGIIKAVIIIACYFVLAKLTKYIMEGLYKQKHKVFRIVCIVFACMDICSIPFLGWKIISVIFPTLFLFIITVFLSQNSHDKKRKEQFAYYRAREEIQLQREKEISKIRHDIANHLSVMKEMEKDETGRCLLKRIDKNFESFTGIPVLDCLIFEKERKCVEKKIQFAKQGICFSETNISEYDLVSLFANLLDNAIEAAWQTKTPTVELKVENWQGYLKITITNSKSASVMPLKNNFRTTKKDSGKHGIGNRIVKDIVESRDGWIQYEDKGAYMKTAVIMAL